MTPAHTPIDETNRDPLRIVSDEKSFLTFVD